MPAQSGSSQGRIEVMSHPKHFGHLSNGNANTMLTEDSNFSFFLPLTILNFSSLILTVITIKIVIPIGGLLLPLSTVIFPITYFFGDVIAESYGYKKARFMLWSCFLGQWFFAIMLASLVYISGHLVTDQSYILHKIGNEILWLTFSNSVAVISGAFVNAYVICKLKINMSGRRFWLRSIKSTILGESVVTLVAGLLAFNTTVPPLTLVNIIFSAYIFKIIYGVIAAFPAQILTNFLKKREHKDVYDTHTNFNPFVIRSSAD